MAEVFISHSSEDLQSIAQPLCKFLEDAGITCWLAPRDIPLGDRYPERIAEAIARCRCVLVVMSENCAKSPEVPKEVQLGSRNKKRLIALYADDTPLPVSLQFELSSVHSTFVRDRKLEECAQEIIDQLREQLSGGQVAATPTATVTMMAEGTYLVSDAMPYWRERPREVDELVFRIPDRGERRLAFPLAADEAVLGRDDLVADGDDPKAKPFKAVSRRALALRRDNGRVWLRRHEKCSSKVAVGIHELEPGDEQLLFHDAPLRLGSLHGSFFDRRYFPDDLPDGMLDPETSLLSFPGLLRDMGLLLFKLGVGAGVMAMFQAAEGEGPELALQVHALAGSARVARRGRVVVALMADRDAACTLVTAVRQQAGAPVCAGYVELPAQVQQLDGWLEDACEALAQCVQEGEEVPDLRTAWHVVREPEAFMRAHGAVDGGPLGLMAIEEFALLRARDVDAYQVLTRELMADLGVRLGREGLLSRPTEGVVAFAGVPDPERVAQEVSSLWRNRGSYQGRVLELTRQLAFEVVQVASADELVRRARGMAAEVREGVGTRGLPFPIAFHAHRALTAPDAGERALAAMDLVKATEWFLGILFHSFYAVEDAPEGARKPTPQTTWHDVTPEIAWLVENRQDKLGELARSLYDEHGRPRSHFDTALRALAQRASVPGLELAQGAMRDEEEKLEDSVKHLLLALRELRGWSLISVERVDRDAYSDRQRVQYVDHTGPDVDGERRQLTLVRSLHLGPFVYFARLYEAIAVPLEPFIRRQLSHDSREQELFLGKTPFDGPGQHPYGSPRGSTQTLRVDERHFPRSLRPPAPG